MNRVRRLALILVALGAAASLAVAVWPARWAPLARLGLLLGLPFLVGVVATLVLPRSPRRLGQSARVRGTSRFHAVIAGGLALDLGAFWVAARLDWAAIEPLGASLPLWRIALFVLALPLCVAVGTLGLEWALHARIWSFGRRQGAAGEAVGWALVAGVALAAPALAPAWRNPEAMLVVYGGLGVALARELTLLLLFRSGGIFVAGAYRGTLLAVDALGLGVATAFYRPVLLVVARLPVFHLLRLGGPLLALALVALAARRPLDSTPA